MSDAQQGLVSDQGVSVPAVLGAGDHARVSLRAFQRRYVLRVKDANRAAVAAAAGVDLPAAIGARSAGDGVAADCLGPDEWMISAPVDADVPALFAAAPQPFSLVDISHRNVAFSVEGPGAVALINVGCPLDLSLAAFPVGKTTRTVFERAEILLRRTGETAFDVETWRSFAPYLLAILAKNAGAGARE